MIRNRKPDVMVSQLAMFPKLLVKQDRRHRKMGAGTGNGFLESGRTKSAFGLMLAQAKNSMAQGLLAQDWHLRRQGGARRTDSFELISLGRTASPLKKLHNTRDGSAAIASQ